MLTMFSSYTARSGATGTESEVMRVYQLPGMQEIYPGSIWRCGTRDDYFEIDFAPSYAADTRWA